MKIAIYLRISEDDGTLEESQSITNQRRLIYDYIRTSFDEVDTLLEYMDDGFSGTDFNRPGFNNLLIAANEKKFNTLVIKDLSRLGRNYIEVGNYLNHVFPKLKVNVISINEHYDSLTAMETNKDLEISLYNIIHDYYSKDLSKKMKSANRARIVNGTYKPKSLPYGYKYNKFRKIVIDDEAAEIVRLIQKLYGQLKNYSRVAKILNERGVVSRGDYLLTQRGKTVSKRKLWQRDAIKNVVDAKCYKGTAVFNRARQLKVGSNRKQQNPIDEWIVIEEFYPVII